MPEGPQSYRNFVRGTYIRGIYTSENLIRCHRALLARSDCEFISEFQLHKKTNRKLFCGESEKQEICFHF